MDNFMLLKIHSDDPELKKKYQSACIKQKNNTFSTYPDAGFDLFMPNNVVVDAGCCVRLPQGVKCAAFIGEKPSSFYMYPRSSMGSKTTLRMCNSVGIIDSGYRGELVGVVDNIGDASVNLTTETRLFQICAPQLIPILVEVVENIEELGFTSRGEGGFGSTLGTVLCDF
jgi:dUTP pyrophosphatase